MLASCSLLTKSTNSRFSDGLRAFFDNVLQDPVIEAQLGTDVLELPTFVPDLFHSLHLDGLHFTLFRASVVRCGVAHSVFTADVFDRLPGLDFLQDRDDVSLTDTTLLHAAYSLSAGSRLDETKLCAALLAGSNTGTWTPAMSASGTFVRTPPRPNHGRDTAEDLYSEQIS